MVSRSGRERKPKPVYTFTPTSRGKNIWICTKFESHLDLDPLEHYEVVAAGPNAAHMTCSCFAGLAHKVCRHKKMYAIFQLAGHLGNPRKFYCFDHESFKESDAPQRLITPGEDNV